MVKLGQRRSTRAATPLLMQQPPFYMFECSFQLGRGSPSAWIHPCGPNDAVPLQLRMQRCSVIDLRSLDAIQNGATSHQKRDARASNVTINNNGCLARSLPGSSPYALDTLQAHSTSRCIQSPQRMLNRTRKLSSFWWRFTPDFGSGSQGAAHLHSRRGWPGRSNASPDISAYASDTAHPTCGWPFRPRHPLP